LPSLILKDNPSARFTFIGQDSLHFLKEYLVEREKIDGKKLSDSDLIFSPKTGKREGQFGYDHGQQ
jgi:hypothetical protein